MGDDLRGLMFQLIDGTISSEDFKRLQDAIESSDDVRKEYLRIVNLGGSLTEIANEPNALAASPERDAPTNSGRPRISIDTFAVDLNSWGKTVAASNANASGLAASAFGSGGDLRRWDLRSPGLLIAAAAVLMFVSGIGFWFGQQNESRPIDVATGGDGDAREISEPQIAGHATLRRVVDLRWSKDAAAYHEGDVLPDGLFQFEAGVAEIDFFCGASLIVEGPAKLDVKSDWSVRMLEGRLRANVPPAARGFKVLAADAEVIDLGTEFALEVQADNARIEVIDGEVELRGGTHNGDHLLTGQKQWLKGGQDNAVSLQSLSTIDDVQRRCNDAQAERFAQWKAASLRLRVDQRLIAYYPIAETQFERTVRNSAASGGNFDGQLVGPVNRTTGRFGVESSGLEFDRPGARLRTRIDGEFEAFTFACWVQIDSLDHRYNALFMGDGYENGEPHWQIRDDGCLMFSVMVDDTQDVRHFNGIDQQVVRDAGLHRVYYTEPIWDVAKSGQWFHLAAVYDPNGRTVRQYVNGDQVSREEIIEKFHIKSLRIGAAEIGNWGQPFRQTPWFSVRNLNGTIDELAIFNATLTSEEIHALYEQGKPLGY